MNAIQISNSALYEFHSTQSLVDEVYHQILNTTLSYGNNTPPGEKIDSYSMNGYVLTEAGLTFFHNENLFNWFNDCLRQVASQHFSRNHIQICDLWIMKQTFGERSARHIHTNSIFSGLYYLTDQESSETVFYFDDPVYNFFSPFYDTLVKQKPYTYISKPKAGKLLIWPSYLPHSVNVLKEKNTRYSISFNTMLSGLISGDRTGYCDVRINPVNNPNYIIKPKS